MNNDCKHPAPPLSPDQRNPLQKCDIFYPERCVSSLPPTGAKVNSVRWNIYIRLSQRLSSEVDSHARQHSRKLRRKLELACARDRSNPRPKVARDSIWHVHGAKGNVNTRAIIGHPTAGCIVGSTPLARAPTREEHVFDAIGVTAVFWQTAAVRSRPLRAVTIYLPATAISVGKTQAEQEHIIYDTGIRYKNYGILAKSVKARVEQEYTYI